MILEAVAVLIFLPSRADAYSFDEALISLDSLAKRLAASSKKSIDLGASVGGFKLSLLVKDRPIAEVIDLICLASGCTAKVTKHGWKLTAPPLPQGVKPYSSVERERIWIQNWKLLGNLRGLTESQLRKESERLKSAISSLRSAQPIGWESLIGSYRKQLDAIAILQENENRRLVIEANADANRLAGGQIYALATKSGERANLTFGRRHDGVMGLVFRESGDGATSISSIEFPGLFQSDVPDPETPRFPDSIHRLPRLELAPMPPPKWIDQDSRPTLGELVIDAARRAGCEAVSLTARTEALSNDLPTLDSWAETLIEQNRGAIGYQKGVLVYRNASFDPRVSGELTEAELEPLAIWETQGIDPSIWHYAKLAAGTERRREKLFYSGESVLLGVSNRPLQYPNLLSLLSTLTEPQRDLLNRHIPISAASVEPGPFVAAFFEAILSSPSDSSAKALSQYLSSGGSLEGLQLFADQAPTGRAFARAPNGRIEAVTLQSSETAHKKLLAIEHVLTFKFGMSDQASGSISFLLRSPVSD